MNSIPGKFGKLSEDYYTGRNSFDCGRLAADHRDNLPHPHHHLDQQSPSGSSSSSSGCISRCTDSGSECTEITDSCVSIDAKFYDRNGGGNFSTSSSSKQHCNNNFAKIPQNKSNILANLLNVDADLRGNAKLNHLKQFPAPPLPPFPREVKKAEKNASGNANSCDSARLTAKVALAAIVSFFTNSLPSGFNMGVVNTPEEIFKEFFNFTMNAARGNNVRLTFDDQQIELMWSIAVSLLLVGAFFGCTFTGYLADTIGRRGLLTLNALAGLAGVSLCWLAKFCPPAVPVFMAGRFVAGLHTGVASSLVPMYLIEIAPPGYATLLGALHVMGMNGGQMLAQTLGLEPLLGSHSRWQLLFFVNATFIIAGLAAILACPESPAYLFVMRRDEDRAIAELRSIRGERFAATNALAEEIAALRREQKSRQCREKMSFAQLLRRNASFRNSLLIVCALHAGQQLIGINAIFYYSTKTFRSVGLDARTSQYSSIGCTTLNTASALIAIPLIRRFAPRRLLLISGSGTIVSLALLTLSMTFKIHFEWLNYVTIALILVYVFAFAIGQGPIPYMIGGELFDQSSMAIGMSIGCFVNWFCNFLIAITFPLVVLVINQYVFLIFIFFNLLLIGFIYWRVPHAKREEPAKTGGPFHEISATDFPLPPPPPPPSSSSCTLATVTSHHSN